MRALFCLITAAALAASPGAAAQHSAAQSDAASIRAKLRDAGLPDAERVQAEHRQVRRLLANTFLPGRPKAIEIEKVRGGRTLLHLVGSDGATRTTPIADAVWDDLAALDGDLFAAPIPERRPPGAENIPVCHGTMLYFQKIDPASDAVSLGWGCRYVSSPMKPVHLRALTLFGTAALATVPDCARKTEARPMVDRLYACLPA